MGREYPVGGGGHRHCHRRAQLLYAVSGTMLAIAGGRSWILLPRHALWIPAGTMHEVHCRSPVSLRTVYIEPAACPAPGQACKALAVSDLLAELLAEASRIPVDYDPRGRDGLVMRLILDEIAQMESLPLDMAMPRNAGLVRLCREIICEPRRAVTLDDCAARAGMPRRSFTRRFREEVGISFLRWHRQVRLREGFVRLGEGQPVSTVAADVGYDSLSAFTVAFRRHFNLLPSQVPISAAPAASPGTRRLDA